MKQANRQRRHRREKRREQRARNIVQVREWVAVLEALPGFIPLGPLTKSRLRPWYEVATFADPRIGPRP